MAVAYSSAVSRPRSSAELETGAANDSGVGSALDPDPHGRRIKPGEGQVSLMQERPQLVDIDARHREVDHDSSLRADRYSEASTAARCNDHLKPPIGYRTLGYLRVRCRRVRSV